MQIVQHTNSAEVGSHDLASSADQHLVTVDYESLPHSQQVLSPRTLVIGSAKTVNASLVFTPGKKKTGKKDSGYTDGHIGNLPKNQHMRNGTYIPTASKEAGAASPMSNQSPNKTPFDEACSSWRQT